MKSESIEVLVPVSAKIPKQLFERLQDYKQRRAIKGDSEAIREILRYFLLDIWPKQRAKSYIEADSDAEVIEEVTPNA